jgi:hypothetical protein
MILEGSSMDPSAATNINENFIGAVSLSVTGALTTSRAMSTPGAWLEDLAPSDDGSV